MTPPTIDDDEGVTRLPVTKKEPPNGERMLVAVPFGACQHFRGPFQVDVKRGTCRCLECQADVSPMFVLEHLMHQESQWMQTRAAYQDEMQRLAARARTKCQHCGQITRISHR